MCWRPVRPCVVQVADELGKLSAFNAAEKQPALDKLLDMQAACNEATAVRQAQRAGSSPQDTAPVEQLAAAFAKLSEAEAALRSSLVAKQQRMLGPTMELERLRRGCRQVSSWVLHVQPITSCAEAGATEGEVRVQLEPRCTSCADACTYAHTPTTCRCSCCTRTPSGSRRSSSTSRSPRRASRPSAPTCPRTPSSRPRRGSVSRCSRRCPPSPTPWSGAPPSCSRSSSGSAASPRCGGTHATRSAPLAPLAPLASLAPLAPLALHPLYPLHPLLYTAACTPCLALASR